MAESSEILQGTLDLLILRTLELGPMHGLGISDRIKQITRGGFVVGPGSLFPALKRLEQSGWIEGYNRAFETTLANVNDNRSLSNRSSTQSAQTIVPNITRPESNGYIRGPRGGCYYLSGSGRKVYVDRGLCN